MTLVYIYFTIFIIALLSILFRKKIILVRGKTLFIFHFVFFILSLTFAILTTDAASQLFMYYVGGVAIVVLPLYYHWAVFKVSGSALEIIIKDCLNATLCKYQKQGTTYIIHHQLGETNVVVRQVFRSTAIIQFKHHQHNTKVEVFKNLLRKQFAQLFPRIIIRT